MMEWRMINNVQGELNLYALDYPTCLDDAQSRDHDRHLSIAQQRQFLNHVLRGKIARGHYPKEGELLVLSCTSQF